MNDLYCYEGTDVLKNKLDIRDSKTLDLIEAEQSRMAMMLTMFVEYYGYYIDKELLAESAGYAGRI